MSGSAEDRRSPLDPSKHRRMKRHFSRRRWAGVFAACVIPFIHCSAAARAAEPYAEQGGAMSAWAHSAIATRSKLHNLRLCLRGELLRTSATCQ